jgi:hypothetical protein
MQLPWPRLAFASRSFQNSAIAGFLSLSTALYFRFSQKPISHCGWDGSQYCQMFFGQEALEPFRRRIVPPAVAKLFGDEPLTSFYLMNALSIILVAIIGAYLITQHLGNANFSTVVVTCFVLVLVSSRNTFRILAAPVLTDGLALFWVFLFFLGVFLGLTANTNRVGFAVILVSLSSVLGTFSRESLGPAFFITSVALLLLSSIKLIALVAGIGSGFSTFIILIQSSAGSSLDVIARWIQAFTESPTSFFTFSLMVALALGVWPITSLISLHQLRNSAMTLAAIVFSFALLAVSVFGGGNLDRILMPVGISLALVTAATIRNRTQLLGFGLVSTGYILAQFPTHFIGPGDQAFLAFIDFWHSATLRQALDYGLSPFLLGAPFALVGAILFWQGRIRETVGMANFRVS